MISIKVFINYANQGENKFSEMDFFRNLIFTVINEILMQKLMLSIKVFINYTQQGENKFSEMDFFKK
jgi:hypothetical protein